MIVVLGNRDARNLETHPLREARRMHKDADAPARIFDENEEANTARVSVPVGFNTSTEIYLPDEPEIAEPDGEVRTGKMTVLEAYTTIAGPGGIWQHNTHSAGEQAPAWVASDNEALAGLLAEHWGCDVRELDHSLLGPPGPAPADDEPED